MPIYRGTPVPLDTYLEPVVRLALAAVVLPITVVLWWFSAWWWLPIPTLVAIAAHQGFFWYRGDRPITLDLDSSIAMHDAARDDTLTVALTDVAVAKAFIQRSERNQKVVIQLGTSEGPALAIQFLAPLRARIELPSVVDVDRVDAKLGGQAGVLRSIAPPARVARQTFGDPGALTWLANAIDRSAWQRTGIQLWAGPAPPLSPFGFYVGPSAGWLTFDGRQWTLKRPHGPPESGQLTSVVATTFLRSIELMQRSDDGPEETLVEVPYLAILLGDGLKVGFPAPLALGQVAEVSEGPGDFQCHAAEGAALITHLQRVLSPDSLPPILRA